MPQRLASIVASCVLLLPAHVLAESRPSMLADYVGKARSGAVELELGWFTDSNDNGAFHGLVPVLSARVAATDHFDLELDWPFAYVTSSSDSGDIDKLRSGNPLLAGYYVSRQPDGYLRVGVGIAPPIASGGDSFDVVPLLIALAMRGLWDSWLYLPQHLSLVVPFQIERRRHGVLFGADAAIAALIETGDYADASDFATQLAGIVGGTSGPVSAGVRLQLVWIPTADTDNAQVAFVPFVQGDFSTGFVYLRFLVNLDEPYGVFGDGADVWSLAIGAGGRF